MRLTAVLLLTTLLTVAFLTGCAGPKASNSGANSGQAVSDLQARNVPILGKAAGGDLNLQSYYLGVLDDASAQQLGLVDRFADAGLTLDSDRHSVILLSLGEQPTAGFSADIVGLQRKGNELFVQGIAVAPGAESVNAQQLTTPFCAVAVPRLPSNLRVRSDISSRVK